jgi:hypothetical protein
VLNALTTKLEIDVLQANEMQEAFKLASEHQMPAVVVHPNLTATAILMRGQRRGVFKIITPVDWPKGETYGLNKLRGMSQDNFASDGFEIMVSGGRSPQEAINEVRVITDFIRRHVSPTSQIAPKKEIRFVLGCFMRDEAEVLAIAAAMRDIQAPAMVRIDHHLKVQTAKANAKTHCALMEKIRKECATPIKLCGNIDSIRIIASCLGNMASGSAESSVGADRFAVSLSQMRTIIQELAAQPDELYRLLQPAPATVPQPAAVTV